MRRSNAALQMVIENAKSRTEYFANAFGIILNFRFLVLQILIIFRKSFVTSFKIAFLDIPNI